MAKYSPTEFAAIWNNRETYPTIRDVAEKLGCSYGYAKIIARRHRKRREVKQDVPQLISRADAAQSLLIASEQLLDKTPHTVNELLDTIKQLYYQDPNGHITRLRFRSETGLADSVWTQHFGTFLEFKRQAGLDLSRTQHMIERQIAKHVSVDHYRLYNDRHSYSDRYIKPASGKYLTIIGCSDLHDIECDPFYLRVLTAAAKMVQPDVINFGGDVFDLAEFGKYQVDPREWDAVGRIKFVHNNIFRPLRNVCPDAQMDFIEGNHECLGIGTEVLTKYGWVKAESLSKYSLIASYTMDGKSIDYSAALAIKTIEDAKLYSVKGDLSDELVSETHRIDVDGRLDNVTNHEKINSTHMRYAIDISQSGIPLTDDEIRLMVWVVMDGTIVSRKHQPRYKRIQFKLSKDRKIDTLRGLLDRMEVPYTFRKATMSGGNKLQPYYITIYGDAGRAINDLLNNKKQLPDSFSKLNKTQLSALIDSIVATDGWEQFNHSVWITTSKSDADIVQMACIMNDVPCKIVEAECKTGYKIDCKMQYRVSIFNKGVCDRRYVLVENEHKTGAVIAIQTVNGTLITRRNGKVSFTGNCRLLRHMADATPALRSILSDLMGLTVSDLFGLKEFQINYIAKGDLSAYTAKQGEKEVAKSYKIYENALLVHHHPHARQWGLPGWNGHHHQYKVFPEKNALKGAYKWLQLGCGHRLNASYCEGEFWDMGFVIAHINRDTKAVTFEYISVSDTAVVGGIYFEREPHEI